MAFQDDVFYATVRIETDTSIGSGFFVRDKENEGIVVSNKHVFGDPSGELKVQLHSTSPGRIGVEKQRSTVRIKDFRKYFVAHPNDDIDLAYVRLISAINEIPRPQNVRFWGSKNYTYLAVPDKQIYDAPVTERGLLMAGEEVWFVGYPDGRFDERNYLPILRRGYVASLPHKDFNGKPEFVVDAQVHPGSSGSPVFAPIGKEFKLIGIVSETMIKHELLQTLPAVVEREGIELTIGLGIVIKVAQLKELIDYGYKKMLGLS